MKKQPQRSTDALDQLIASLRTERRLKVWSLIITFFGDAVVPRGGAVSAITVQTLMQRFGIEAGAVRTAFSRLVKDGWVVREKRGRNAFYRLSDHGMRPFQLAENRIYAAHSMQQQPLTDGWLIALHANEQKRSVDTLLSNCHDGFRVNAGCVLFTQSDPALLEALQHVGCFSFSGHASNIPDWVKALAGPAQTAQSFDRLIERFAPLSSLPMTTPLDVMAVRCLLIHEWRRALLRSADLPAELLPSQWPQQSCRQLVALWYDQWLALSEHWLDSQVVNMGIEVVATAALEKRFKATLQQPRRSPPVDEHDSDPIIEHFTRRL